MNPTTVSGQPDQGLPNDPKRRFLLKASLLAGGGMALGVSGIGEALASAKANPALTHNKAPNRYIEAAGVRFAYRRFGADKGVPVVFFQHFRGTMDWWDPAVTDGIGASRPVILFDNRGVGLSSGETPNDMASMASDAAHFIKALGLTQVDILGFSMGGFVAQELALTEPELVRRVILAGTGPQGGQVNITPEILSAITQYPDAGANRAVAFFTPSEASQAEAKRFIARTHERVDREPLSSVQTMQAQGAAIGAWNAASNSAYNQRLAKAKQSFLIVNGSNDLIVATINSFTLWQALSDAQLILYPDSGHGSIFQHHARFVNEALLFLNGPAAS